MQKLLERLIDIGEFHHARFIVLNACQREQDQQRLVGRVNAGMPGTANPVERAKHIDGGLLFTLASVLPLDQ